MRAAIFAREAALGALAGVAASAAMNLFQSGWSAAQGKLSPEPESGENEEEPSTVKAANRLSKAAAGATIPEEMESSAGNAVHYGFGALLGAFYAGGSAAVPALRAGFGLPFATLVWASADEAAVPAVGLSKAPTETAPSTHLYSLVSHLVFGAALESARRALAGAVKTAFAGKRQPEQTIVS